MKVFHLLLLLVALPTSVARLNGYLHADPEPEKGVAFTDGPTPEEASAVSNVFERARQCGDENNTYYHLRMSFTSSSDWAKIEIKKPEYLMNVKVRRLKGKARRITCDDELMEINRPKGKVTLLVDYAVQPQAVEDGLEKIFGSLNKGSSGSASIVIMGIYKRRSKIGSANAREGVGKKKIKFFRRRVSKLKSKTADVLSTPRMAWSVYYPWYRNRDVFASNALQETVEDRDALRKDVDEYWTKNRKFKDRPIGPKDMDGEGMVSYDKEALQTQVKQAMSAGIDGFLPYYRGRDHFTHGATGLLLEAAREESNDFQFHIGLHVSPQGAQENSRKGRSAERLVVDWITDFVQAYGNHPMVYKVDSKPLAIVYSTGLFKPDEWERCRRRLKEDKIEVFLVADNASATDFDEYLPYFDGAIGREMDTTRGRWLGTQLRTNGIFSNERPKLWMAEAKPGFDNADRGKEKNGRYISRKDGKYFDERFKSAKALEPQWMRIVSWNEYYENTHIEPSDKYGDKYLDLARREISEWKNCS